jgi:hypothetical protein
MSNLKVQRTKNIPACLDKEIECILQMCGEKNFNPFGDLSRKWKKLSGLKNAYSFRYKRKYRVLLIPHELLFIGHHNEYDKKIVKIKRIGGAHGNRL